MAKGPVLIELEGEVASRNDVNTAPTLPDPAASNAEGQAMQTAAKMMARKPSFLAIFLVCDLYVVGRCDFGCRLGLCCRAYAALADTRLGH